MKKTTKMVALLLMVILSMNLTAEASEKYVPVKPKLSIRNNTATCSVKVTNTGYLVNITLYLYKDGTPMMSWTRSDTSTVEINETYSVTTGHTYYTYAYVTTGGHSYTGQSGSISI